MSKNLSELSARKGLDKNLFETISNADKDTKQIAKDYLIGKSSITGAASFYDFLKEDNKNKKVYVCNGSACLCAGTQDSLTTNLRQHFKEEEIGHMTCLGRCHQNSAFHYQGKNYSNLSEQHISKLIRSNKKPSSKDKYHTDSIGPSLLTGNINIDELYDSFKKLLKSDGMSSLKQIKTSGLRGRGGAGFPIGFKLESARNEVSDDKYIICNADEGDPGAYSDRYLLEKQPHLVLYGMLVAGFLAKANYGVLYIRAEYPDAIKEINKSIKHLKKTKLIGKNIAGSKFDFQFKVISAQGAYICGEETALINSIEGQRPEVRVRPPFPTQQGLFNKPTVVNNVETLASIYSIIKNGGKNYNQLGTDKSSGTKLVSLDSFFNKPGVYEVEMGTPLIDVFENLGGGFKQKIKAVHIGGPLGGIVPRHKLHKLNVSFESFAEFGFLLGHASVVCIPESFKMIDYLHHLFEFAAYESCGKCFPCRLGTKRGEEMLMNAIQHNQRIDSVLFNDLLDTLEQGSLCAHGGGIPLPIKNALMYFQSELKPYFTKDSLENNNA